MKRRAAHRGGLGWGLALLLTLGLALPASAQDKPEGGGEESKDTGGDKDAEKTVDKPAEKSFHKVDTGDVVPDEQEIPAEKSIYGPIQHRLFDMNSEISFGWAYLPLDPYCKGYGVQVAYTLHLSQIWALELFRVGWSYNVDSKLKTKLIDQMPDISPAYFPAVVLFENTNVVLKLLYGKHTLMNRTVLHFEIFATGGIAFLVRNPFNFEFSDDLQVETGLNIGFGFRVWIDPTWSVVVDLRDTVSLLRLNKVNPYFHWAEADNSALVGLSLAFNL
jgi:hypothetical protein